MISLPAVLVQHLEIRQKKPQISGLGGQDKHNLEDVKVKAKDHLTLQKHFIGLFSIFVVSVLHKTSIADKIMTRECKKRQVEPLFTSQACQAELLHGQQQVLVLPHRPSSCFQRQCHRSAGVGWLSQWQS